MESTQGLRYRGIARDRQHRRDQRRAEVSARLEQKLILACGFRIVIMKAEMSLTEQATDVVLADHTTLRVGGPARRMITVETEADLVEAVRDLDATGQPLLVLGGGSNLLISDAGFDGTVIKIATRGLDQDTAACSGAVITVAAGEPWDPLVRQTIEEGWSGLEAMSGIPGLVGATPIQNVGAYGADVSELISCTYARPSTGQLKTLFPIECASGTGRRVSNPIRELCGVVVTSAPPWLAVATDPVRRAGPGTGRCGGGACSSGGRAASRARAPQCEGHGARGG